MFVTSQKVIKYLDSKAVKRFQKTPVLGFKSPLSNRITPKSIKVEKHKQTKLKSLSFDLKSKSAAFVKSDLNRVFFRDFVQLTKYFCDLLP